jgi:hypothetical protein
MGVSKLEQAIAVIKSGDKAQGRRLLVVVLQEEPRNAKAWLWMSAVVDDPERRRKSLLTVLEIEPENELAKKGLARFGWLEEEVAAPAPAPPTSDALERQQEPQPVIETILVTRSLPVRASNGNSRQEAERWLRISKMSGGLFVLVALLLIVTFLVAR